MRRLEWWWLSAMVVGVSVGCGDGTTPPVDPCGIEALPLRAGGDGPTVTDVALEVQGSEVVLLLTATDPQGDADLLDVTQRVHVMLDAECTGGSVTLEDDLAGSGVEESFGTVADANTLPALAQAIAMAERWPVRVEVRDAGGNSAAGTVAARVVR